MMWITPYLGLNTVVGQAFGNGVTETTTLDQFGRTAQIKYVNSSDVTTDDFQYGYDQDGNVLYEINGVNSAMSQLYTYDNLNRLTSYEQGTLNDDDTATTGTPSEGQSWTYDALGNQIAVDTNGTTVDSTVNSQNELTENGSNDLAFDNDGNTKTDENGSTYIYDAWNRLISVTNSSSTVLASYAYDADGNRMTETSGATVTVSYFSSQGQVVEERQSSTVINQNVWGILYGNDLVERDDNSTSGSLGISGSGLGRRIYLQQDADWNDTTLVSATGSVLQRATYSSFGIQTVLTAGWGSTTDAYDIGYGYQDMLYDPITGLSRAGQRYYSAGLDRWLQQDGGYWDGMNVYQFLDSNPVGNDDPSGMGHYPVWGPGNPGYELLERQHKLMNEDYTRDRTIPRECP